jgi:hypothetical protein
MGIDDGATEEGGLSDRDREMTKGHRKERPTPNPERRDDKPAVRPAERAEHPERKTTDYDDALRLMRERFDDDSTDLPTLFDAGQIARLDLARKKTAGRTEQDGFSQEQLAQVADTLEFITLNGGEGIDPELRLLTATYLEGEAEHWNEERSQLPIDPSDERYTTANTNGMLFEHLSHEFEKTVPDKQTLPRVDTGMPSETVADMLRTVEHGKQLTVEQLRQFIQAAAKDHQELMADPQTQKLLASIQAAAEFIRPLLDNPEYPSDRKIAITRKADGTIAVDWRDAPGDIKPPEDPYVFVASTRVSEPMSMGAAMLGLHRVREWDKGFALATEAVEKIEQTKLTSEEAEVILQPIRILSLRVKDEDGFISDEKYADRSDAPEVAELLNIYEANRAISTVRNLGKRMFRRNGKKVKD